MPAPARSARGFDKEPLLSRSSAPFTYIHRFTHCGQQPATFRPSCRAISSDICLPPVGQVRASRELGIRVSSGFSRRSQETRRSAWRAAAGRRSTLASRPSPPREFGISYEGAASCGAAGGSGDCLRRWVLPATQPAAPAQVVVCAELCASNIQGPGTSAPGFPCHASLHFPVPTTLCSWPGDAGAAGWAAASHHAPVCAVHS